MNLQITNESCGRSSWWEDSQRNSRWSTVGYHFSNRFVCLFDNISIFSIVRYHFVSILRFISKIDFPRTDVKHEIHVKRHTVNFAELIATGDPVRCSIPRLLRNLFKSLFSFRFVWFRQKCIITLNISAKEV